MLNNHSLLIIICLFGLFNLKEIKIINIGEKKEFTYVVNKKQTFSLELPKNKKPKNLQISIESSNSLNQIISFSNSDIECQNSEKHLTKKSDFFIDNYQLSNKKKYLCIECAENNYCELKLSFNQNKKQGYHLKESEITLKSSSKNLRNVINLSTDTEINLYTLSSTYATQIQIPSDYLKIYQIPGTNNTYRVSSGYSVGVTSAGTVYPQNTTYYYYYADNMYSTSPIEGKTPDRISTTFENGKSTISITSSDKTVTTITVNVIDYATLYADKVLSDFVSNNITNTMTTYEKFKKITSFPAQYAYNGSYSGYVSMIIMKGGDCWASSSTILELCKLVGIKAHLRFAANEPLSGSGHRNVAALIDGKIYVGEAGYGTTSPNRAYTVTEENVGFYLKKNSNTKTASLLQYDGFEENIIVPEKIDNYTINELGTSAFYYGKTYSGVNVNSIKLPDTIEIIGDSTFFDLDDIDSIKINKNVKKIGKRTFSGCSKIEKIEVDNDNKYFYSDDGVLYDYNKTKLLSFPTAKSEEYTALTSLKEVDEYSFYYTEKIKKIILPGKVEKVGEGAFGNSPLKEIYFAGKQPEFGRFAFAYVNATVYYSKNEDWETKNINIDRATKIRFAEWDPPENLSFHETSYAWIWIIVIIILILGLGFVGYILYKKKFANSASVEGIGGLGKLL